MFWTEMSYYKYNNKDYFREEELFNINIDIVYTSEELEIIEKLLKYNKGE